MSPCGCSSQDDDKDALLQALRDAGVPKTGSTCCLFDTNSSFFLSLSLSRTCTCTCACTCTNTRAHSGKEHPNWHVGVAKLRYEVSLPSCPNVLPSCLLGSVLHRNASRRILDVGCGNSTLCFQLRDNGLFVYLLKRTYRCIHSSV